MLAFGAALAALPFFFRVSGTPRVVDLVAGFGALGTAALYLASPTWRSYVVADERALSVMGPRGERLRLPWEEVIEVIADEEERAALVRGPQGGRSFLLPSGAHPAPYRVEGADKLYARILEHVPAGKVRQSKEFR
jgi:hypothetical protein